MNRNPPSYFSLPAYFLSVLHDMERAMRQHADNGAWWKATAMLKSYDDALRAFDAALIRMEQQIATMLSMDDFIRKFHP